MYFYISDIYVRNIKILHMKKLLLSISVALSANWCSSQITFSSQDLQESGKTYVTKTDTITIVNIGSAS